MYRIEYLTNNQRALLITISESFSPDDNAADTSILYEITDFQTDKENNSFWIGDCDFEELGDENLVRKDRIEENLPGLNNQNNAIDE